MVKDLKAIVRQKQIQGFELFGGNQLNKKLEIQIEFEN